MAFGDVKLTLQADSGGCGGGVGGGVSSGCGGGGGMRRLPAPLSTSAQLRATRWGCGVIGSGGTSQGKGEGNSEGDASTHADGVGEAGGEEGDEGDGKGSQPVGWSVDHGLG